MTVASPMRWMPAPLDVVVSTTAPEEQAPPPVPPTLEEIQAIQDAAYREGLKRGLAEGVDAVGTSSRDVEVRLHPDDIAALSPLLTLSPQQRLVPDAALSRGDLRVHAESVRIDGTLEARLRGALDKVMRQVGSAT